MATIPDSSVKPTLNVTPNSRFATTFLSTKYRDRAVNGEVLMDKSTGELFIKRTTDGKVVSFYQNKKNINEIVFDAYNLISNNTSFKYPNNNDNAFYVSTNYDLVATNNETLYDLTKDNIIIDTTSEESINSLSFRISGESNGFFCRHTTRDVDKGFIEFLTNQYNTFFKNYIGDNETYKSEQGKFTSNEKWEKSNAIITYDVICAKDDEFYDFHNIVDYIRLNDDSVILIPDFIYNDIGSFDYAIISIKSIEYNKIHFMINHKNEFGIFFEETYDKLIHADDRIEVSEFVIHHFIDYASDIEVLGNENIIAFLDTQHINSYISKMTKSSIIVSNTQPNFACVWFNTISEDID